MTLFDEFAGTFANVGDRHRQWAIDKGLSKSLLWRGPAPFGAARIEPRGDIFEFSDSGRGAVIVPVADYYDPWMLPENIVDIVAFFPGDPTIWWTLRGAAPVLNAGATEEAVALDKPLLVWASPLSWLQHEREGLCVLDFDTGLRWWLAGITRILCENEFLAHRIQGALRVPFSMPEIRHREARDAA